MRKQIGGKESAKLIHACNNLSVLLKSCTCIVLQAYKSASHLLVDSIKYEPLNDKRWFCVYKSNSAGQL